MTVMTRAAPSAGLAALNQALGHLNQRQLEPLSKTGGTVNTSKPMEVFTVRLDDIYDAGFLSKAVPHGWRYLVIADAIAMADVRGTQPAFANLTHGRVAESLQQAAHLAESTYGSSPIQFEARVLEIPALYVIALWLHAAVEQRNAFFWVADGTRMDAPIVAEDPGFVDDIVQRAKAKRSSPTATP